MREKIIAVLVIVGFAFTFGYIPYQIDKRNTEEKIKAWSQVDKKINDLQFEVLTLKKEAIQLGYARYNGTNGTWQWITTATTNK